MVFGANAVVFGANAVVFGENALVFEENMFLFGENTVNCSKFSRNLANTVVFFLGGEVVLGQIK